MSIKGEAERIRPHIPEADDGIILRTMAMGCAIFDVIKPKGAADFADGGVALGIAMGKLVALLSENPAVQEAAMESIIAVAAAQAGVEADKAAKK